MTQQRQVEVGLAVFRTHEGGEVSVLPAFIGGVETRPAGVSSSECPVPHVSIYLGGGIVISDIHAPSHAWMLDHLLNNGRTLPQHNARVGADGEPEAGAGAPPSRPSIHLPGADGVVR